MPIRLTTLTLLGIGSLLLAPGCDSGETAGDERGINDGGESGPRYDLGIVDRDGHVPDAAALEEEEEGPTVNSVIPNRGPIAGGTRLRVVGDGFVEGTEVRLGATPCLDVEVVSLNHIWCTTPPVDAAGSVRLLVRWPDRGAPSGLEKAFEYFPPLEVRSITPAVSPIRGGGEVVIEGTGFVDPTSVRIGPTAALRVRLQEDGTLTATAPPGTPGAFDVVLRNINGEATLEQAFVYREDLVLDAVSPIWGAATGGEAATLTGAGLIEASEVRFGQAPARIRASEQERTRLVVETPAHAPGVVGVEAENVNGRERLEGAFLFIDTERADFSAVGVVPTRAPTAGGTDIWVGGSGFDAATQVAIDGEAVPCEVEAAHLLRCRTLPHDRGEVDVRVTQGAQTAALASALRFYLPVELFDVLPRRGAVAGNTVVEVIGSGFTEDIDLTLDGQPMSVLEVVDGATLWALTPPGQAGLVALNARNPDDRAFLTEAFEYFDPAVRFGGLSGEPIGGAINVTVWDAYTSEAIDEAQVLIESLDGELRMYRPTNAQGQVTLSTRTLSGPISVTAAKAGYEVATFERVTVENVAMYLRPHESPSGGGRRDPVPPARLVGTISGIGELEKPLDPDLTLVAFVDTTHTSPYNRAGLPWPEPNGILEEDGPFEVFCRPGELAAIVTAAYVRRDDLRDYREGRADYWDMRDQTTPIAMGVQRFISVSPGEAVENLAIAIDRPMDLSIPVTLDNPSGGARGGPSVYEADVRIDFGAEGYWLLDTRASGPSPQLLMRYVPDVSDWDADIDLFWVAVARADNETWDPYTVTIHNERDVGEAGLLVGPNVGAPYMISPLDGASLGDFPEVEWGVFPGIDGPTEPASANMVVIQSSRGLPLWTHVTPGPVTQYTIPALPEEAITDGLIDGDTMFLTLIPFISGEGFDYAQITYDHLNGRGRRSYGVTSLAFER